MSFSSNHSPSGISTSLTRKLERRAAEAQLDFELFIGHSPERRRIESYIADNFRARYGANIENFLPELLALQYSGELCGAVGLQRARNNSLFLEQYLKAPVEQEISQGFQRPVDRAKIIEIGNLVATRSGGSYLLFAVLAATLYQLGNHWMIFTATEQVERIIQKMGFVPLVLCEAKPELLRKGQNQWGTYYDTNPKVMAGYLPLAYEKLTNNAQLSALIAPHLGQITQLVRQLERDPC